jgi:DNA repair exonuclease SbcCD ATPase subunit
LGEGGSAGQVRASIRLRPEVAKVWARLDKATRARLGALFNDLVLLYGKTGRLPAVEMLDIASLDLLIKGLDICRAQLRLASEDIDRLKGELENVKARLGDIEVLEGRLKEAQASLENLRKHASSLESDLRECRDEANYYGHLLLKLAELLCNRRDELASLVGDQGATYVEALCRIREGKAGGRRQPGELQNGGGA